MHPVISRAVLQYIQWVPVQLTGEDSLSVGVCQSAGDFKVFSRSSTCEPWSDRAALLPCVLGEIGMWRKIGGGGVGGRRRESEWEGKGGDRREEGSGRVGAEI